MVRAVFVKDVLLLSRDVGWRLVLVGYLVVFVGFSLVSYSELAVAGAAQMPRAFWERLLMGQWVLLTALTPWVVARFGRCLWGDALVRLIAQAALTPWQVLLSTAIVGSLYLGQLLLMSLPVMTVAECVGVATVSDIVWSYVDLFVWLLLVQGCTMCWSVGVVHDLLALVLAYAMLLVLVAGYAYLSTLVSDLARSLMLVGCIGGLALLGRHIGNARFVYLRG
jgi:hypothetical protein